MTQTKKPKPPKTQLKVPCERINRIISLRRLTDRQLNTLTKELKEFIISADTNDTAFEDYAKHVVWSVIADSERDILVAITKKLDITKANDKKELWYIIGSIYAAIVNVYMSLRIDYICSEINKVIPENLLNSPLYNGMLDFVDDEEFDKSLEKNTKKVVKAKTSSDISLEYIKKIELSLKSKIIGQDEAIESVCNVLKLKLVGFIEIASMFFLGKTGRGKTQLAKYLGEMYSGNFWVINCAEFSNGHEVNRLIGAPPGYLGSSEKSVMFDKAEKSNKWVIVFDEIEKAHDKFFNFLLALLDTGKVTDNSGRELDFSDSIFIFTSNCGAKDLKDTTTNFHSSFSYQSNKNQLEKSLKSDFSPEFRNRIDEFVYFNDLSKNDAKKIADLNLSKFPVEVTDELLEFIVTHGFSDEYGAREIGRFIKKNILIPMSEKILSNTIPISGKKFKFVISNDSVVIEDTLKNSN